MTASEALGRQFGQPKHTHPLGGPRGPEAALRFRADWEQGQAKTDPSVLRQLTEPVNHGAASALFNYQHGQTHVYSMPQPGRSAEFGELYDLKKHGTRLQR